jgi:hypothetical protein
MDCGLKNDKGISADDFNLIHDPRDALHVGDRFLRELLMIVAWRLPTEDQHAAFAVTGDPVEPRIGNPTEAILCGPPDYQG